MNHENIKVRNEQILNDYVAGMSVEAISEKYQLSSYHCYSILRQLDYRKYKRTAVKSRSPFPDRNRQIIDEYRNGVSATELTKKYKLSRARVYKILSHSDKYLTPPTIEIVGFLGGAARFITKTCLKQRVMRFPTVRYGCSV